MRYKQIIDDILAATQENGKMLVRKLEHRQALEKIRDFDLASEWIEQKELTKHARLIGSYLLKAYPELLPQSNPDFSGWGLFASDFVPANLKRSYQGFRYSEFVCQDVEKSKVIYQKAEDQAKELSPLADHFEALAKRSLRNGKLPKQEAERRRKEIIKGSLDPSLEKEISRLKDKWEPVIYEATLTHLISRRDSAALLLKEIDWKTPDPSKALTREDQIRSKTISRRLKVFQVEGVVKSEETAEKDIYALRPSANNVLEKIAQTIATDESDGFYYKMADKLGGLVTDSRKTIQSVADWNMGRKTPFESAMRFTFSDGSRFVLQNTIVHTRSALGHPFFRYPTTFHDAYNAKGEKIANPDENRVKAAFLEDLGVRKIKR